MKQRGAACLLLLALALPRAVNAQVGEGLIVQAQVPQAFDRDRNLSVTQTARPDYTPLGLRLGSFNLAADLRAGMGATSNTYSSTSDPKASVFVVVQPSASLSSDWTRHSLQISGSVTQRDYIGETKRQERLWSLGGSGRLEVSRALTLQTMLNASRNVENAFSGEVIPTVAALSRYRRNIGSAQATYTSGRLRAFLLADYTDFRFSPIPLLAGGLRSQRQRDRDVRRVTGQVEYARSPNASLFVQLSTSGTRYDQSISGGGTYANSDAARVLLGANLDVAGWVRGTVGVGYSTRNYDLAENSRVGGISVETRLEMFVTPRLTVAVTGERSIEDSPFGNRSSYWSTRVATRADYEVLRNLIIFGLAEGTRQKYLGSDLRGTGYGASAGGRFLGSRRVSLEGSVTFNHRSSNTLILSTVNEGRGEVSVRFQL